ncbi:hypothetical protein M408DRAFT_333073 [Serendipita vermifera MAFF 305830]|uniref:Uncharacterized protein n=1 Tax=Serendipita vermifera MAFF 305830 TaxID=933852 RepID=A0A0C2WXU1_SERVB|nr:hypothetical protein M408DRAFT_333073 [Serendipita vermifera MAFF 305830]
MYESPNVPFQTIHLRPSPVSPPYPVPVGSKYTGIQPSFTSNPAVPAGGTYKESGNGLRDERKARGIDPGSYEESEDMGGGRAAGLNTHSGRRMVYSVAGHRWWTQMDTGNRKELVRADPSCRHHDTTKTTKVIPNISNLVRMTRLGSFV